MMQESKKPKCKLIGTDGNVFALAGRVRVCLRRAGMQEKADEFSKKLLECQNYGEALALMMKYVDVT